MMCKGKCNSKCSGSLVICGLLVLGGLNWGLVGVFGFDIVSKILGNMTIWSRIVYVLIAIAALIKLVQCGGYRKGCSKDGKCSLEGNACCKDGKCGVCSAGVCELKDDAECAKCEGGVCDSHGKCVECKDGKCDVHAECKKCEGGVCDVHAEDKK